MPILEQGKLVQPDRSFDAIETWVVNDGDTVYGARHDEQWWLWSPGLAAFCFTEEGPVVFDPARGRESAARQLWLRSLLPLALQARGTQVLHAGALAGPNGVIAICGRSTAGKSTLVAAARSAQLRPVADDALAFRVDSQEPAALTLPFELRLRPAAAAYLAASADVTPGSGGEVLPLALILVIDPDAQAGGPEQAPIPPTEAVGVLMPHAYCFSLAFGKEALVAAYAGLVERVPVVRLRFRPGLELLDDVVAAVQTAAS